MHVVGLVHLERAVHQVDVADEVGDEARRRRFVDVARRADLQEAALAHDGDARGHGHGFFLVVRDHHAGHADLLDDVHQLDLRFLAQLLVQRAQRLVQQQQLRLLGQAARQRHALLLAARQLVRLALGELAQLHQLEHGLDALGDLVLGQAVAPQAEGDVVPHAQVREQRVALEHHVHRPLVRRQRRPGPARRARCGRRWASRSRPACAAACSCRSPRSRAARRSRPWRCRG